MSIFVIRNSHELHQLKKALHNKPEELFDVVNDALHQRVSD